MSYNADVLMVPLIHPGTVELRFAAAPVARVIETLARDSEAPLGVDPAVGREIVSVSLTNVSPPDAMERLARALDARWEMRDGVQTPASKPRRGRPRAPSL